MGGQRMKVVVVEDEALSRKRLVRLLQEAGCLVVASFAEGRGALEWLGHHPEVQALFLDIHMPNLDGLAILKTLSGQFPVVLTTAFTEHAVEAFDGEAVDYLLKPVTASRLDRALNRIEGRWALAASAPTPVPVAPGVPTPATAAISLRAPVPSVSVSPTLTLESAASLMLVAPATAAEASVVCVAALPTAVTVATS